MVAVTMEVMWCTYLLWVLVVAPPAHTDRNLPGLSCVNDYVRNVSCTWNSSHVGTDCWVLGTKKVFESSSSPTPKIQRCQLKQVDGSAWSCTFVFENLSFSPYERLPSIQVVCNGTPVENITNYSPKNNIKLHPPSVPSVITNDSETLLFWSTGSPLPYFIQPSNLEFEVQIKRHHQKWQEARTLITPEQKQRLPAIDWMAGHYQVRLRVKTNYDGSHWSDWSLTAHWDTRAIIGQAEAETVPFLDLKSWLLLGGLCLVLFLVALLVLFKMIKNPRLFRRKQFPDPSKYFHPLHSVNEGNLKRWLNPQSEPFFTQPSDLICPVEVDQPCPLTTTTTTTGTVSSLTTALFQPPTSSSSPSSSSCFSSLGYFRSGGSSVEAVLQVAPSPVYFTYQEGMVRALARLPARTPSYERLKLPGAPRHLEPQSPDSGFGMEDHEQQEEEEQEEEEEAHGGESYQNDWVVRWGTTVSHPLILLPVNLSPRFCSVHPPHPPGQAQRGTQGDPGSGDQDPGDKAPGDPGASAAHAGSYAAWPVATAMGSASSMPASTCNTGYLTVKELQASYSNKSI